MTDKQGAGGEGEGCILGGMSLLILATPFVVVAGLMILWRYPAVARKHKVSANDLVLHQVRLHAEPPHFREAVIFGKMDAHWIRFEAEKKSPGPLDIRVTRPKGGGFRHTLMIQGRPAETRESALHHFSVTKEQLARAKEEVGAAYALGDPATRRLVLMWGYSLFVQSWARQVQRFAPGSAPPDEKGTEDEYLFCVWEFLGENLEGTGATVPTLGAAVRRACGDAARYADAMAWARRGLRRQWPGGMHDPAAGGALPDHAELPPLTDFTCWLVLARAAGTDEASEAATRDRWLGLFLKSKRRQVLAWGADLLRERRAEGDHCPPGGDETAAALCVLDRLGGADGHGERVRKAAEEDAGSAWDRFAVTTSIMMGVYPNDDVYLLMYGTNPCTKYVGVGCFVVLQLVLLFVLWLYVERLLGENILRLGGNPLYEEYKRRREGWDWLGWLLRLGTPLLAYLITVANMSPAVNVLLTQNQLLIGVYITTWIGGRVLEVISNVVAMLLIRVGIDPDYSLLDEIVAFPLAWYVLSHFQNDYSSMLSFALAGLLPTLALRIRLWQSSPAKPKAVRPRPPASAPPPVPPPVPPPPPAPARRRAAPPPPIIDPKKNPFDFS